MPVSPYPAGNHIYPSWEQALFQEAAANKSLDQATTTNGVFCVLLNVDSLGYKFSYSHQFYTDLMSQPTLSGGVPAIFNVGSALAPIGPLQVQVTTPTVNITGANLVFDGDDVTFLQVQQITAGQNVVSALALYRANAGPSSTWRLIYYCDNGAGFPVQPVGGNVTIQWNAGGIFTL